MRITTKQFSDDPGRWVDYARTNGPVSIVGEGGEVRSQICIPGPVSEFEDCRHEEELTALRAENARLRECADTAEAVFFEMSKYREYDHSRSGNLLRAYYKARAALYDAARAALDSETKGT